MAPFKTVLKDSQNKRYKVLDNHFSKQKESRMKNDA